MSDDRVWEQRFRVFTAARLTGLFMFITGIFLAFTDVGKEGGMPLIGSVLAMLGALDAVLAPKLLRSIWAEEDAKAQARERQ